MLRPFLLAMPQAMCIVCFVSCVESENRRQGRPSESGEDSDFYVATVEKDIRIDGSDQIELDGVEVHFPDNFSSVPYTVRLSRLKDIPQLDAEIDLQYEAASPAHHIEVFETRSNKILSSDAFLKSYAFSQSYDGKFENPYFVAIYDPSGADRQTIVFDDYALISRSNGAALDEKTRTIEMDLSDSFIWLISPKSDETNELGSSSANQFDFAIEDGKAATKNLHISARFTSPVNYEAKITSFSGCHLGGEWIQADQTAKIKLSKTNSLNRVYAGFRPIGSTDVEVCLSKQILHDDIAPSSPEDVMDGSESYLTTTSPAITWSASSDAGSGIAGYELAVFRIGESAQNWIRFDSVATVRTVETLSLMVGETYQVEVRAFDNAGNLGPSTASDGWTVKQRSPCPANYILIAANETLGVISDFCVMKYEARNVNGQPISTSSGLPWRNIARGATISPVTGSALAACQGIGQDLMTNAQWQTIARNIESVSANWRNGSPTGTNYINQGHTGSTPFAPLESSTDDRPCANTGVEDCELYTSLNFSLKRTHLLSNGDVIWDFSGNLAEWVKDDNTESQGNDGFVISAPWNGAESKLKWGPAGDYGSSMSVPPRGGLGHSSLNYANGAISRGGGFSDGQGAGIFSANLNIDWINTYVSVGFRCVVPPMEP